LKNMVNTGFGVMLIHAGFDIIWHFVRFPFPFPFRSF
jgi:hypothetical protein